MGSYEGVEQKMVVTFITPVPLMHQWAYLLRPVGSVTLKGKFYHQIDCRSFFSDRFLRVDQEIKNKEDRKTGVRRFCTSYDYAKQVY